MNSSGHYETKTFPEKNDTQFNRKIHVHDRGKPRGFHLIEVLDKGRKFNAGYYIAEILEPSSHCPNGTQLKQWATSEKCWCMPTMRTRIPPSYQVNILTRIE
jgi:hypothetical protein